MLGTALVIPSRAYSAARPIEPSIAKDDAILELEDSAFFALTDFRENYPVTVDVGRSIDGAFSDMARFGVQALLITKEMRECDDLQVLGLITAYDIERERPYRSPGTLVARVPTRLNVLEVMTPWNELPLINYASLDKFTAGDINEMFKGTGLTHLLVIDINRDDSGVARGLFSRTTLSKRLRRHHNNSTTHPT